MSTEIKIPVGLGGASETYAGLKWLLAALFLAGAGTLVLLLLSETPVSYTHLTLPTKA